MVDASEVRIARRGRSRELRVGGTFASSYRPGRLLTGSVWDALAVPLLALPPERRREILVLGLGGGSAARLLRAVAPDARIVGVELDPNVVAAARAHLDLDALALDVRVADARCVVRDEDDVYDLVIEDCFVGGEDGLIKPRWLPEPGIEEIAARLAPGGVLACDAIHGAGAIRTALRARFRSVVRVELHDCTNEVFVATDRRLTARALRAAVARHPLLSGALGNLRFRTERTRGAG